MLPPLHYQGMDAAQPFGYQPAPPGSLSSPAGMHPSRVAALAAGGPIGTPALAGTIRSADEMEADRMPPAKRQKVAKLPGGQCYPEADWISMHPVSSYSYLTLREVVLKIIHTSTQSLCKCNFLTTRQNLSGSSTVVSSPFLICLSTCWYPRSAIVFYNIQEAAYQRLECDYRTPARCLQTHIPSRVLTWRMRIFLCLA